MANKFVRGITNIIDITKQRFRTNDVNDLLSTKNPYENYIRTTNSNTKKGMYHCLTDNVKSINGKYFPKNKENGNDVTYLPDWSTEVINKPFERLSTDFNVVDGVLWVNIDELTIIRNSLNKLESKGSGSTTVTWSTLSGKPFSTLSDNFFVDSDELSINVDNTSILSDNSTGVLSTAVTPTNLTPSVVKFDKTGYKIDGKDVFISSFSFNMDADTFTKTFSFNTTNLPTGSYEVIPDLSNSYVRIAKPSGVYDYRPLVYSYSSTDYGYIFGTNDTTSSTITNFTYQNRYQDSASTDLSRYVVVVAKFYRRG